MAQTLTRLLVHIVFSTKDRAPLITHEIQQPLYAYLGGICRNHESPLLAAGGVEDHVHLLVSLSKNISVSELMLDLKRDSSAWAKTRGPQHARFYWQDGYGAFTIGESQVDDLNAYFARQADHHKHTTFQDEFRKLLANYGVEFDERYLWR